LTKTNPVYLYKAKKYWSSNL